MYLFLQRNKETISLHIYIELCCIIISSMYFLLVTYIIEGTSLNVVISEQSGDFLYSWSRRYLYTFTFIQICLVPYLCMYSFWRPLVQANGGLYWSIHVHLDLLLDTTKHNTTHSIPKSPKQHWLDIFFQTFKFSICNGN